ncbi:MAG TPA: TVP38/TMEM64 family protein [Pirellulales bacterium]|nr:TVP38/TMEM64 family protein [Pirellulales bacterium]
MKKPLIQRIVAAALLLAAGVAAWRYVPRDAARWGQIVEQVRALGAWGPLLLAAVYVPASVLMVPGSWLTLAGAFAFGMPRAFVAVSAGSVAGACAAFLVSRYLLRDWIERKLARSPRLQTLDRAVDQQGFKIVFLARLSPLLPFGVLNYAFGASKISFSRYALATWTGMLPGTLMYCYLGSAARQITDLAAGNAAAGRWQHALFFVGLAATILVTRLATQALREVMENSGD